MNSIRYQLIVECEVLDAGYWIRDTGCWRLETGLLVTGIVGASRIPLFAVPSSVRSVRSSTFTEQKKADAGFLMDSETFDLANNWSNCWGTGKRGKLIETTMISNKIIRLL